MKEIMMELEHFGGFFFSFVTDDDLRAATNGRNAIKIRNKSGNLFRNERPRSRWNTLMSKRRGVCSSIDSAIPFVSARVQAEGHRRYKELEPPINSRNAFFLRSTNLRLPPACCTWIQSINQPLQSKKNENRRNLIDKHRPGVSSITALSLVIFKPQSRTTPSVERHWNLMARRFKFPQKIIIGLIRIKTASWNYKVQDASRCNWNTRWNVRISVSISAKAGSKFVINGHDSERGLRISGRDTKEAAFSPVPKSIVKEPLGPQPVPEQKEKGIKESISQCICSRSLSQSGSPARYYIEPTSRHCCSRTGCQPARGSATRKCCGKRLEAPERACRGEDYWKLSWGNF